MATDSQILKAIEILEDTQKKVSELFANDPGLLLRHETVFSKLINSLKHTVVITGKEKNVKKEKGELTHIFGREIKTSSNEPVVITDLNPREEEMQKLKETVEKLHETFTLRDSKDILESTQELPLRALAKRLKLPHTREEVKEINIAFIDSIKLAITKKEETEKQRDENLKKEKLNRRTQELIAIGFVKDNEESYTLKLNDEIITQLNNEELSSLAEHEYRDIVDKATDDYDNARKKHIKQKEAEAKLFEKRKEKLISVGFIYQKPQNNFLLTAVNNEPIAALPANDITGIDEDKFNEAISSAVSIYEENKKEVEEKECQEQLEKERLQKENEEEKVNSVKNSHVESTTPAAAPLEEKKVRKRANPNSMK